MGVKKPGPQEEDISETDCLTFPAHAYTLYRTLHLLLILLKDDAFVCAYATGY